MAALGPEAFARERLSIGDYPAGDAGEWGTITADAWSACVTPDVRL